MTAFYEFIKTAQENEVFLFAAQYIATKTGDSFLKYLGARKGKQSVEYCFVKCLEDSLEKLCYHYGWEYDSQAIAETFSYTDKDDEKIYETEYLVQILKNAVDGVSFNDDIISTWINYITHTIAEEEELEPLYKYIKLIKERDIKVDFQEQNILSGIVTFNARLSHGEFQKYIEEFTGRNQQKDTINKYLRENDVVALTGGPGLGKTALAVQYAKEHLDEYEEVLFLNCETALDVIQSLNIVVEEDYNFGIRWEITEHLKKYLEEKGKILLIFDNVGYDHSPQYKRLNGFESIVVAVIDEIHEDYKDVDIILTARRTRTLVKDEREIPLKEMEGPEAKEYLLAEIPFQAEEREAEQVIKKYGTMPIVLNMVKSVAILCGGYKNIRSIYVDTGKDNTLDVLFKGLFDELKQERNGQLFITILKIVSFLDSDNIQSDLILKILRNMGKEAEESHFISVVESYAHQLNILKWENNIFSIHRAYQDTIKIVMDSTEKKFILEHIIEELRRRMHWFSYYGYNEWNKMRDYLNHIDRLYEQTEDDEKNSFYDGFLQSAWYTGYVMHDDELYDKYYKRITASAKPEAYVQGLALCDKILIHLNSGNGGIEEKGQKLLDKVKKILKRIKGEQKKLLKVRFCLCASEYKRIYGNADEALKDAEEGTELCKKECKKRKSSYMSAAGNNFLYVFFEEHRMMLLNQNGKINRLCKAEYKSAIDMHEKALKICHKADVLDNLTNDFLGNNYKVIEAYTLNAIGVCWYEENENAETVAKAIEYYNRAYKVYFQIRFYSGMANELLNCCCIYRQLALFSLEKSEKERSVNSEYKKDYYIYLSCAEKCLEEGYRARKNGAKLDVKFLKDYFAYHYEIEIAKSKDSALSNKDKISVLQKADNFLGDAGEVIKNINLPSDMCRQKRYRGILYRKMAEYSDNNNEKRQYYKDSIHILNEVIKEYLKINDIKGYQFSVIELALTYWSSGEEKKAKKRLQGIREEIQESKNAGMKNRLHVVEKMIGFK